MIRLSIAAPHFAHTFDADKFAVFPDGELAIASIAGPDMAVRKAFAAVLNAQYAAFTLGNTMATKSNDGYKLTSVRLADDCHHLLIVSKRAGLLLDSTCAWLWMELSGKRYTTPVLVAWVPWLAERLRADGLLVKLKAEGCEPALLTATTEDVDRLVSAGLANGELQIERAA